MRSSRLWASVLVLGMLTPTVALAAPPAGSPPASSGDAAGGDSKMSEARARYERGLQLYDEGDYDGARVEFEKAYELAPSYRILYNVGLVRRQQADYVGALRNFENYLDEGGTQIVELRRNEVARDIAALKKRIATITVTTNTPGAQIFVDDVLQGTAPLKHPVLLNPGRRKVTATKQGKLPATQMIEAVGEEQRDVKLTLEDSRTVVVEVREKRVPWVGWVATGVLAVGAGVFGYAAVSENSKLDDARARQGADPDDLSSRHSRRVAFGITADVMTVAAVAVGGISLYYTIKWNRETQSPAARVGVSPIGPVLSGTF